ncbi:MAG: hypothetical protein BroJett013_07090 [Alphaproteobacteria bacterium]|nr:MAG: hypothetical protein BroJett013_07090 [Alphaproteobacteria bacterium]
MSAEDWTEERVNKLKTLWAQGLSCSQIAAQLGGGFTRNAVIGKRMRLGLPDRMTAGRSYPARAKRTVKVERPRVAKPKPAPVEPPRPIICDLAPLVLENGKPAGVFDLTDSMCKFPIGDPSDSDFAFCGRESSHGPYCKDHARLAYQPSGEGEKRRKAA